jgi:hypothetical protein
MTKGFRSGDEHETESKTDITEVFWNKSECSDKYNVNDISSSEAVSRNSLFSSVNKMNCCKYDRDELDNSYHPIEEYMANCNQTIIANDDSSLGNTDLYSWNKVFNISSDNLHPHRDDFPVCDYFKILEESNY